MAYADIGDKATGDVVTEGDWDQIRANFLAGVPDILTAEGDIPIATGANAATPLALGAAGSVLVAGAARPEYQVQPAAHVTAAEIDPMAQATWTAISFTVETADTDGMHAAAPYPGRLTIPAGCGGWYAIGFAGAATRGSAMSWQARIIVNGTTVIVEQLSGSANTAQLNANILYPLSAGDYLQVQYYTSGATDVLEAGAAFYAVWMRR